MFQDKAQTAKNGPVLLKGCNTVLGHLGASPARRASGNCSLRCSNSCIRAVGRPTTSQLAELVIITLKEH